MATPKLRFKEFGGDWAKVSLDNVSKVFDGTHQTPNYVDSGIKFVSVENIHAPYESDKFITGEAFKKDFKNQPQKNDILMTRITAGEIGATAIVDGSEPLAYYVSLALIRPKANVTTPFLNQYIRTPFFKKELHKRIIHVAFPKKINLGDINECLVAIPSEYAEQTQIASFLSAVDEKLAQLTQKHELLSQYKQGMMQKLFSQQIRFKADDGSEFGKWHEYKFGNCIDVFDNLRKPISASDRIIGNTPYYGANGIQSYIDGYTHDGEFILIAEDGANDLINYPIQYVNGKIWVNNHAHVVSGHSDKALNKFLKYLLKSIDFTKYLVGGGRAKLNAGAMKEIILSVPCLEEQTKIANFLYVIDQKIEKVSQQIEETKQWKKGLLQQMFV